MKSDSMIRDLLFPLANESLIAELAAMDATLKQRSWTVAELARRRAIIGVLKEREHRQTGGT